MEALERILSPRRKSRIIENVILKISQYSTMLKFSWSRQARTTLDFYDDVKISISISPEQISQGGSGRRILWQKNSLAGTLVVTDNL